MKSNLLSQIDFGPFSDYLENDDITDISYSNRGQLWLKTLSKGLYRIEDDGINDELMEKIAFQCANVMGKSFNTASPTLDAESTELRLNFVHESIATNGIACVIRKTPAKIRLQKEKILEQDYITLDIHDFLVTCVRGHCNILVAGETGTGKTELVKYLAAHTKDSEKIITIEDTIELHLDRIFPHRDIVAMKTNNIMSYSEILITCMRQNPKWILLSEVRSAEAVTAVRNSISSGHNIISTIHADKASNIPHRLYSLLETNLDLDQFMKSMYRYIHLGVMVRAYQDPKTKNFKREVAEVCEFYVTDDNEPESRVLYFKGMDGKIIKRNPSKYLLNYLGAQGIYVQPDCFVPGEGEIEDLGPEAFKLEVEEAPKMPNPMVDEVLVQQPGGTTEVFVEQPVAPSIPVNPQPVASPVIQQGTQIASQPVANPVVQPGIQAPPPIEPVIAPQSQVQPTPVAPVTQPSPPEPTLVIQ